MTENVPSRFEGSTLCAQKMSSVELVSGFKTKTTHVKPPSGEAKTQLQWTS